MRVLVTGAAGFIGYFVSESLLQRGEEVVGVDNLNDYYDPALKQARLARLLPHSGFRFEKLDISDRVGMERLFEAGRIQRVVHLAAQAGVRHSLTDPHAYVDSNLTGFLNVLEGCRHNSVEHLVFASSSSVYGANKRLPFSVGDNVDHPVSLYAATKKANELMAHSYSHLYGLSTTGLRFFTVYGPWGRPDMAYFKFVKAILEGRPIDLYNRGDMARDFTYIDDIVQGVVGVLSRPARPEPEWEARPPRPASSSAPYRLYNIGAGSAILLMEFVHAIERALGVKARYNYLPMQPGDVQATHADVAGLAKDFGYRPTISLGEGMPRFITWYRDYFGV